MKIQHMSSDELKSKVTNWIIGEGITYTQTPDENMEFRLNVDYGGHDIDVVKGKGTKRLFVTSAWGFQEHPKAFTKLTKKQRAEFLYDLETGLLKFPVEYAIELDSSGNQLNSISFDCKLYLEDLTKTSFFEALGLIYRCKAFTRLFAIKRLEISMGAPDDSDPKAGVA